MIYPEGDLVRVVLSSELTKGSPVFYARTINGNKSVVYLTVRSIYKDFIVGCDTEGMALSAPYELLFRNETDAKEYEPH